MIITAGETNKTIYVYFQDDDGGTAPGEPTTGLLFSDIETGGTASYVRTGGARVDMTLITLASASAAHADGGFILVDDSNMKGLYRLDLPDAATSAGVPQVVVQLLAASANNTQMNPLVIDLTADLTDVATQTAENANHGVTDALITSIIQSPHHMVTTTIATLTDQQNFTLAAGPTENDALNACVIVFEDTATTTQRSKDTVSDYVGSTKGVVLSTTPTYTIAVGDHVRVSAPLGAAGTGATPAEVNAEMVDVLKTDVITLPGQEAPPLAPTFEEALSWLYKTFRNRTVMTATVWSLYADDESTVDSKATVSDDGTTAIKQEIVSGPL